MKKLFFLFMALSLPLFFTSCSSDEPQDQVYKTRSVEYWFKEYDAAYDGFWEYVEEINASADWLSRTTWLPNNVKTQFIDALWVGGATMNDPEYPWEETAFVVKEVLSWGGDNGNKPTKIRYTLWALQIVEENGREYFRYFIPETSQSYYTVEINPNE